MDLFSLRFKSFHPENMHEQASGLAPKPPVQPVLFESHDIDSGFPEARREVKERERSTAAAMTATPGMRTRCATSIGQEQAQASRQSNAQQRPELKSSVNQPFGATLEEVQSCIAEAVDVGDARLDLPNALKSAAVDGHVNVVEYLLPMEPLVLPDVGQALIAVANQLVCSSSEAARNRLVEVAKKILHSTTSGKEMKNVAIDWLQHQGNHEAADALRSIRL